MSTVSERLVNLAKSAASMGQNPPQNTFQYDTHMMAMTKYKGLERWEKIARSTAYAVVNQEIFIDPGDKLVGRIYFTNDKGIENFDPDFDHYAIPNQKLRQDVFGYDELMRHQLIGHTGTGHISWNWGMMLEIGTSGLRAKYQDALTSAKDDIAAQFYQGVLIMLDAFDEWNDLHVKELTRLGMHEMASICAYVPKYPARTFHEAVQATYIINNVVLRENPSGGNSAGRLDYYLWPYLERDLQAGTCTLEDAGELVRELFIRMDEKIHRHDGWGDTVSLGGSHPDGSSAVTPLSYIMIEAIMDFDITHPLVYARLPKDAPADFIKLCAKYVREGGNRAQILADENIIPALTKNGVSFADATNYACGGCMEISIQGMSSDFIFNGWQNITKMAELFTTGGVCLKSGDMVQAFNSIGLAHYNNFEDFYAGFVAEATRLLHIFLNAQDLFSEEYEKARPSYLISSMIDDCLPRGRNMHGGGARYHDYGSSPIGLPNTADYLFAIKKAVFEDKICTAQELINALTVNFVGHEALRQQLIAIPKYGQEDTEADSFAATLFADIANIYNNFTTRWGGHGKCTVLTFIWAPEAGENLGATADGNLAGKPVAQGLSPQVSSMSRGLTSAINSCTQSPFHLFYGGASTMWDLDPAWASEEVIQGLFMTFFAGGGQIYQGNVVDVSILLEAQKNPSEYRHLIVRVGGYSARFVDLGRAIQEDIITRIKSAS